MHISLVLGVGVTIVVVVVQVLSVSTQAVSSVSGARGVSFDLIHRHSPLSPYSKSKSQQQLQNAAFRSPFETDVIPANDPDNDYIMRIYVGIPPIETWAVADSGSDLVWLQCLPCINCYPQYPPIFDPLQSISYTTLTCDSPYCIIDPNTTSCGISGLCVYQYGYLDESTTMGDLGMDFINFGTFIHHKTVLGCGRNQTGEAFAPTEAGVVGLGNGPLSLVSQLGPIIGYKFSYCLVPYSSNSTGNLKLGEIAAISQPLHQLASTPYTTIPGQPFYLLTIEGISVGDKTTLINNNQSESGEIAIDSGTSNTTIPTSFYNRVETLVKEAIGATAMQNPPGDYKLCFMNEPSTYNKINNLSFVVIFMGSAKVSLKPYNIFVPQGDLICFAIIPTDGPTPIYGNRVQVDFSVLYDLDLKMVSFAPTDCSKN